MSRFAAVLSLSAAIRSMHSLIVVVPPWRFCKTPVPPTMSSCRIGQRVGQFQLALIHLMIRLGDDEEVNQRGGGIDVVRVHRGAGVRVDIDVVDAAAGREIGEDALHLHALVRPQRGRLQEARRRRGRDHEGVAVAGIAVGATVASAQPSPLPGALWRSLGLSPSRGQSSARLARLPVRPADERRRRCGDRARSPPLPVSRRKKTAPPATPAAARPPRLVRKARRLNRCDAMGCGGLSADLPVGR